MLIRQSIAGIRLQHVDLDRNLESILITDQGRAKRKLQRLPCDLSGHSLLHLLRQLRLSVLII